MTGHILHGQDVQGYIDYERVVVTLPEYKDGQKIVETRKNQLRDSIEVMFKNFQRMLGQSPHNVKMDSASRASLETTLREFERKIIDAQSHAQTELIRAQSKFDTKLKELVAAYVKAYCVSNKIAYIADHKSILYCKHCVDFTDDLIRYLKKGVD